MPDDIYWESQYRAEEPLFLRLALMAKVPPNAVYAPRGEREAYRVRVPGLKNAVGAPVTVAVYVGELTPEQLALYKAERSV